MIPLLQVLGSASAGSSLSYSYLQSNLSSADSNSYTFTGENIGAADSTRRVVAVVGVRKGFPQATITSITIGGVSASIDATTGTNGNTIAIASAAIPAGTTATVEVTTSVTVLRCLFSLYRITGATSSATSTDTGTTDAESMSVTASTGAVVIGGAGTSDASVGSWTGLTSDATTLVETFRLAVGSLAPSGNVTASYDWPAPTAVPTSALVAYSPA